jgi:hypothetical protein
MIPHPDGSGASERDRRSQLSSGHPHPLDRDECVGSLFWVAGQTDLKPRRVRAIAAPDPGDTSNSEELFWVWKNLVLLVALLVSPRLAVQPVPSLACPGRIGR